MGIGRNQAQTVTDIEQSVEVNSNRQYRCQTIARKYAEAGRSGSKKDYKKKPVPPHRPQTRLTTECTEDAEERSLDPSAGTPQTDSSDIYLSFLTSVSSANFAVNLFFSGLKFCNAA